MEKIDLSKNNSISKENKPSEPEVSTKVLVADKPADKSNKEDAKKNTALKKERKTDNAAGLYTLWFGLDYGSILTAYALYNLVNKLGKKPYLLEKHPALWGDHYADKENIAGKFIYKNCDILEVFSDIADKDFLQKIDTHIVGSDVLWNIDIVGRQTDKYYYLSEIKNTTCTKISYGTSVLGHNVDIDKRNDYLIQINKFKGISVKSIEESMKFAEMYYDQPEIVIDPVFLCDKEKFIECSEKSVAKKIESEDSFIFTYVKDGNNRKKDFILRGDRILMEKYLSPLRNFIDINRYPESKAAIGLEPAFHILVEDWLYYIINSNFVITDDYYGMCFAILFEKDFVVIIDRNNQNVYMYVTILEMLGLSDRLVFTDDDYKTKEYLFRKPVKYRNVNEKLEKFKNESLEWFKSML